MPPTGRYYGKTVRLDLDTPMQALKPKAATDLVMRPGKGKGNGTPPRRGTRKGPYPSPKKTPTKQRGVVSRMAANRMAPRGGSNVSLSTKAPEYSDAFGRVARATKRGKKDKYAVFSRRGVVFTTETRGIVQDKDCVYLGHADMPVAQVLKAYCYALIKSVLATLNIPVGQAQDAICVEGDAYRFILSFRGQTPVEGNLTGSPLQYGTELFQLIVNNNSSLGTVADALFSAIETNYLTVVQIKWLQVVRQVKIADAPVTYRSYTTDIYDLYTSKVKVYGESEFKMQNQSTAIGGTALSPTADRGTDVVNSNPVHGRIYQFKGQGVLPTKQTGQTSAWSPLFNQASYLWVPDARTGVMTNTATTLQSNVNDLSWSEPPPASVFRGVKKGGIVKIGVGQIQKSNLSSGVNMNITRFMNALKLNEGALGNITVNRNYQVRLGNSKYFAIEQYMQDVLIDAVDQQAKAGWCKIAFEHDFKIGAIVSLTRVRGTNTVLQKFIQNNPGL